MTLRDAVRLFIADMRLEGRITSAASERAYWDTLVLHSQDVGNRDPRTVGREDIKRTLARWENPNTRRRRHSILASFHQWAVEEGHSRHNPAHQVRRARAQPTPRPRLTRDEIRRLLAAPRDDVERRAIHLGLYTGLRAGELCGLTGRHLAREGWVHVTADIGKGGRERWVPVLPAIAELVDELRDTVAAGEFVLPRRQNLLQGQPPCHVRVCRPEAPMRKHTLYRLVRDAGERAGIGVRVGPHMLRHAYCEMITRRTSIHIARAAMGHANISTTQIYAGEPTLDEVAAALGGADFG